MSGLWRMALGEKFLHPGLLYLGESRELERHQEAEDAGNTRHSEGHGRHTVQCFWVKEAQS